MSARNADEVSPRVQARSDQAIRCFRDLSERMFVQRGRELPESTRCADSTTRDRVDALSPQEWRLRRSARGSRHVRVQLLSVSMIPSSQPDECKCERNDGQEDPAECEARMRNEMTEEDRMKIRRWPPASASVRWPCRCRRGRWCRLVSARPATQRSRRSGRSRSRSRAPTAPGGTAGIRPGAPRR